MSADYNALSGPIKRRPLVDCRRERGFVEIVELAPTGTPWASRVTLTLGAVQQVGDVGVDLAKHPIAGANA